MARETVFVPEVIEPDEKLPKDLVALRKFAILMDEALPVPGTPWRIGLDAGLGLIPGVGDIISAILSAWIIAGALRHRVPMRKIMRMIFNVVVDLLIGEIPIIGDIFDFTFEENVMNMRLLMKHRNRRLPPRTTSQVAGTVALIVVIIILIGILSLAGILGGVLWIIAQRNR
ncbi:MAG TPA: DUF4112 domain-containing protein [Thermoanaerobaculia bacterium]